MKLPLWSRRFAAFVVSVISPYHGIDYFADQQLKLLWIYAVTFSMAYFFSPNLVFAGAVMASLICLLFIYARQRECAYRETVRRLLDRGDYLD